MITFCSSSVSDVAGHAFGCAGYRVPQVNHAIALFLLLSRQLPPFGVVHRLMAQDPILGRPMASHTTDSFATLHEVLRWNIFRNGNRMARDAGLTLHHIHDSQTGGDLLGSLSRQQQESFAILRAAIFRLLLRPSHVHRPVEGVFMPVILMPCFILIHDADHLVLPISVSLWVAVAIGAELCAKDIGTGLQRTLLTLTFWITLTSSPWQFQAEGCEHRATQEGNQG